MNCARSEEIKAALLKGPEGESERKMLARAIEKEFGGATMISLLLRTDNQRLRKLLSGSLRDDDTVPKHHHNTFSLLGHLLHHPKA